MTVSTKDRAAFFALADSIKRANPTLSTVAVAQEAARRMPEMFGEMYGSKPVPAPDRPTWANVNGTPEQAREALPDLKRRLAEAEARVRALPKVREIPAYLRDRTVRPGPASRWCPEAGKWVWVHLDGREAAAVQQGRQLPEAMTLAEIEARRRKWCPTADEALALDSKYRAWRNLDGDGDEAA